MLLCIILYVLAKHQMGMFLCKFCAIYWIIFQELAAYSNNLNQ